MRIVKLTSETKNKLMSDLLKRTTDDYTEQEIIFVLMYILVQHLL